MKTRLTWPATALLAAAVTTAGAVHAAPQAQPDGGFLSMQFRGGSAAEFVSSLRRQAPHANVLVDPGAQQVPMPAIELNRVTVQTALELLDGRVHQGARERVEIAVRKIQHDPREEKTFHIRARVIGTHRAMDTHVWSVATILERDVTDDAVLAAVELALEVVNSPSEADVRFHEDTGLIIARGDPEQLSVIDAVVSRLMVNASQRAKAAAEADGLRQEQDAMLAEIERLTAEVEALKVMLDQRDAELARTGAAPGRQRQP